MSELALMVLRLGTIAFGFGDSGMEPEKAKRLAGQSASLSGNGSAIAVKLDAVAQNDHRFWRSPGIAPGSSPFQQPFAASRHVGGGFLNLSNRAASLTVPSWAPDYGAGSSGPALRN